MSGELKRFLKIINNNITSLITGASLLLYIIFIYYSVYNY